MPSDDGLTPEQRAAVRAEREAATLAEINEMDDVILRGAEPRAEEEPVVEEQPQAADEPLDEYEPLPTAAAASETPVEEVTPEDEYDFDFINEMARNAIVRQVQPAAVTEPTPTMATQAQLAPMATPPQTIPTEPLATLEEMQAAFESPQAFLTLLERVENRATQRAKEQSLLALPSVATQVAIQVAERAAIRQKFFQENPELAKYTDFVRYCALQVESKHPDWSEQQLAAETAKLAKSRLPELRRAQRADKPRPALPGSGRVQQRRAGAAASGLSTLQKEIDEMPDRAF